MRSKILIAASLAAVVMVVFAAVAAITVFALVGGTAIQTEAVEAVPVIVEPVSQPEVEVVKPINEYERVKYADGVGGCPYNHQANNQMVEQADEKVSDDLLTQAVQ